MEKCSKKSKQLCLGLLKPSVMLLTTGFLSMYGLLSRIGGCGTLAQLRTEC